MFAELFIGPEKKPKLSCLYWSIITNTFSINKLQIRLEIQKQHWLDKLLDFLRIFDFI